MKYLLIYSAYFILSFISCFKEDTCNDKLGNTFGAINIVSSGFDSENNFQVICSMETLDRLPEEYFGDFRIRREKNDLSKTYPPGSFEAVKDLQVRKDSLELTIWQNALPALRETDSLYFYLEFVDRREYIDCMHPGSDDHYYLDLILVLERIAQDSLLISYFSWKESLSLGGF